jgi:hypothetical protein
MMAETFISGGHSSIFLTVVLSLTIITKKIGFGIVWGGSWEAIGG